MIAFQQVSARYAGRDVDALTDVTLRAEPGRVSAVVGPNGSGKSSLIRVLLRQISRRHGSVDVGGRPLGAWTPRDLATQIAIVSQREEPTFPLPVREYVALARFPHQTAWTPPSAADRAAVAAAMTFVEVDALADRTTDTLSGGEWQRVRLARAVAQETPALVLDEPTTFMDVAHEMATFELLVSLAQSGRTILLVSHQLNLVTRFADHVVVLSEGRVAASGTPDTVMQSAILESVYNWPLVVTRDPAVGAPTLVPLRKRRSPHADGRATRG